MKRTIKRVMRGAAAAILLVVLAVPAGVCADPQYRIIEEAEILEIDPPAAGEEPDMTMNAPLGAPYGITAWENPMYPDVTNHVIHWFGTDGTPMPSESGTFMAGGRYKVHVELTADEGYMFRCCGDEGDTRVVAPPGSDRTEMRLWQETSDTAEVIIYYTCPPAVIGDNGDEDVSGPETVPEADRDEAGAEADRPVSDHSPETGDADIALIAPVMMAAALAAAAAVRRKER